MMIGGRHLGGDPPVSLVVNLDERPVATLVVRPGSFSTSSTFRPAALAGEGRYAKLTVSAQCAGGGAVPPVAIEQFNLQSPDASSPASTRGGTSPNTTRGRRSRGAG